MEKLLMRHDDVNTFGVVLYANCENPNDGLYYDRELTKAVTFEDAFDVIPKVAVIENVDSYRTTQWCTKVAAYALGASGYGMTLVLGTKLNFHSGTYSSADYVCYTIYRE